MGNIVVGSAIANGATIENYAILNSAVPAQCYDSLHTQESARWQVFDPSMFSASAPSIPYYAWDDDELSDDPVYGTLGYKRKIPLSSANLINYYLTNDEATVNTWETNQWGDDMLNHALLLGPFGPYIASLFIDPKIVNDYNYDFGTTLEFNYSGWGTRPLSNSYEVMSMVNQSRTKSAGGSNTTIRASNAITKNVNLAGFGSPGVNNNLLHEAVFTRRYYKSWSFYGSMLTELNYLPTP